MEQTTNTEGSQNPSPPPPPYAAYRKKENLTGAVVLIVIGLLLLANNLFADFRFSDYWPLILVGIGVSLVLRSRQQY